MRWREEVGLFEWTIPDSKTHQPRSVWVPDAAGTLLTQSRGINNPAPSWPVLWDCEGRGFGRVESAACGIKPGMINSVLEDARATIGLQVHVTAHVAKHSYCTNWINEHGEGEHAMEKLSRQVGTSVTVLRRATSHHSFDVSDWADIGSFGSLGSAYAGRGRTFESCRAHGSVWCFSTPRCRALGRRSRRGEYLGFSRTGGGDINEAARSHRPLASVRGQAGNRPTGGGPKCPRCHDVPEPHRSLAHPGACAVFRARC